VNYGGEIIYDSVTNVLPNKINTDRLNSNAYDGRIIRIMRGSNDSLHVCKWMAATDASRSQLIG
jgi:hypothetical protein